MFLNDDVFVLSDITTSGTTGSTNEMNVDDLLAEVNTDDVVEMSGWGII